MRPRSGSQPPICSSPGRSARSGAMLADGSEYRGDYGSRVPPRWQTSTVRVSTRWLRPAWTSWPSRPSRPSARPRCLIGLLDDVGRPGVAQLFRAGTAARRRPASRSKTPSRSGRIPRVSPSASTARLPASFPELLFRSQRGDRPAADRLSERGRSLGCRVQAVGRRSAGRLRSHRRRLLDPVSAPDGSVAAAARAGRDRAPWRSRWRCSRVSPVPSPPAPLRPGVPRRVPGDAPSAPPGSRLGRAPAAPTAGSTVNGGP